MVPSGKTGVEKSSESPVLDRRAMDAAAIAACLRLVILNIDVFVQEIFDVGDRSFFGSKGRV